MFPGCEGCIIKEICDEKEFAEITDICLHRCSLVPSGGFFIITHPKPVFIIKGGTPMKIFRGIFCVIVIVAFVFTLGILDPISNQVEAGGWKGKHKWKEKRIVAPKFRVDPFWPKPLPNNWFMGQVAGVSVDPTNDHIWVIQRPGSLAERDRGPTFDPPLSTCCYPAPAVMEFDQDGNLLQAWGGWADPGFLETRCIREQGCEWPVGDPDTDIEYNGSEHGIHVDYKGFVWIGGNAAVDHQVLKFTRDGTFVLQIGQAGVTGGSNDTGGAPNGTPLLGRPANMEVDPETDELYIADGYRNKRVLVVDADTGLYKRHWGAYGNVPDDTDLGPYNPLDPPAQQFRNPVHRVRISNDGLVYVADRQGNRIQVFEKDGTFVDEFFIDRNALGAGSASEVDFSPDKRQTFFYVPDSVDNVVWVLLRETGEILKTIGRGGRNAGMFKQSHSLAVDSKGNFYVGEVDTGQRVQKFKYLGRR